MEALIRWSWLFGVAGVACVAGMGGLWYVYGDFGTLGTVLGIGGAVLLVAYAALDRDRLQEGASTRAFVYGSGSILVIAVAAAIAVFGYSLSKDWDQRWDLTRSGRHTLSTETRNVLAGLADDVYVYGLFQRGSVQAAQFSRLIEGYQAETSRVSYEEVDPLQQPMKAIEVARIRTEAEIHAIAEGGAVLLAAEPDKRQRLDGTFDEERLTNALVRLLSNQDHRICWSRGHGERNPDDDQTLDGYGAVVLKLEDKNYAVEFTDVATAGIDPGCEALVVMRPVLDFQPYELERLAGFVAAGGKLLVMLDALGQVPPVPALSGDLERYGIDVGLDYVIEPDPSHLAGAAGSEPRAAYSGDNLLVHEINGGLAGHVEFLAMRSVRAMPDRPGLTTANLIVASADSWAEATTDDEGRLIVELGGDDEIVGRVPIAAVATVTDPAVLAPEGGDSSTATPGGRVVVVGDSDFASNRLSGIGSNDDLFGNMLAWLVDERDQLGEGAPGRHQALAVTHAEVNTAGLVALWGVPGAAIVLAILVLLRRRRL